MSRAEPAVVCADSLEMGQRVEQGPAMARLFAVACAWSVANVYYTQPLLDALSASFGIGRAAIGIVFTVTQTGSALALLCVVPLGDLMDRRRLALGQLGLLGAALMSMALARSPALLLASAFAVGLLGTALTQGMIAYAATLAAPDERGRVMGTVGGGVMIGLLMARTVAGVLADLAGWRAVYVASALASLLLLLALPRRLPAVVPAAAHLGYAGLLASMLALLRNQRVLQIRGAIALLMFAALAVFWNALVLPLSAPPYGYSHTAIGAFGLVGIVGVLAAGRAGRWVDRGHGQRTTGFALALLLFAWLPLAALPWGWWALVVGIVLLDLAVQAIHITNQSMIFGIDPAARGRLVGCYMLFYAVGSGLGAIASTAIYAWAGWTGVCMLGAAISALALLFWAVTLRRMPA